MGRKESRVSGVERIKVLVVCGSLGVGGAEVQISKLLPKINREVFDVHVAHYTRDVGFPKKVLQDAGLPVTWLGGGGANRWRILVSAVKFMKQERFDLVHAVQDSDNHYGRITAILTGVPVVIGGLQGKIGLDKWWPIVYSLMNFRCAGWIVNSQMLKDWAESKMSFMQYSPTRVVRNGLELEIDSTTSRLDRNKFERLKSGRPVVGIVGRLHPVKNHLLFIEMARKLTDDGVDADYWIIGEGEMRGAIEKAIEGLGLKDRVKLLGFLDDVDSALGRMDIGVLTSDSESCPNALLEAMRASLPVVSTNCTSLENIVEDGCNGYIVDVGDAQGLAEKVTLILSDRKQRQEMGKHSRHIIEERFSMSSAVNDLEEAYIYFLQLKGALVSSLQKKLKHFALL